MRQISNPTKIRIGRSNIEVVTTRQAAKLCDLTPKALRTMSQQRRPASNPAPLPLEHVRSGDGQQYWVLTEVIAWRDARPGRGRKAPPRDNQAPIA